MIYEIQSKSDIISGAALIVTIPEEDLDQKALYTVQKEKPEFILPFRHRAVDGQVEFIYQIGTQNKLQYLTGNRNAVDYSQLWTSLLRPLFACGDWFLRPYSFILDIKHLYCDKNKNSVSYVYIPSMRDCSDYYDLKEMAAEFSRQITVNDTDLENKVLRAIMVDFNPKAFLQMLRAYTDGNAQMAHSLATSPQHAPPQYAYGTKALPMPAQGGYENSNAHIPELSAIGMADNGAGSPGEIIIDIPDGWKKEKKSKDRKNDKIKTPDKKRDNKKNNGASAGGLFRKKAEKQHEKTIDMAPVQQNTAPGSVLSGYDPYPAYAQAAEPADITQNMPCQVSGAWLRLVGNASLPREIDISIIEGEVFTVGRHDMASGRQQSNFEFDQTTKAVSRRHAVIERLSDGYSLIDLSSSAGTFIDGQKLPPNAPCRLQSGCRVSFGNCGADYIWEQ